MISELVTVVVPIYNVEKYLDRCIKSIVNQTYNKLEIILVDDGSPDNCPHMCDEWEKLDARIRVIHKKNAGLGMARNTGIDNANGEYICFFDSDDYIAPDTIEKAYSSAKKYHSDIVMFGMNFLDKDGNITSKRIPQTSKELYVDDEILDFILPNTFSYNPISDKKLMLNMSSSGGMFSTELINSNKWRFVSEREYISEDFYSLLKLYNYVKRVSIVKEAFYFYCDNETSLTHTYNPERFDKICKCHQGMIGICEKYGYSEVIKNSINSQYLSSVIGAMKLVVLSSYKKKDKHIQLRKILKDEYFRKTIFKIDMKKQSVKRKILICFMRKKMTWMVYVLIKAKV